VAILLALCLHLVLLGVALPSSEPGEPREHTIGCPVLRFPRPKLGPEEELQPVLEERELGEPMVGEGLPEPAFPSAQAPSIDPECAPPRVVLRIQPLYPALARVAKLEGEVRLLVEVDSHGQVRSMEVLSSSHKILEDAARQAVVRWVFEPARKRGQPVEGQRTVVVRFELREGS
jgi:protein TonB